MSTGRHTREERSERGAVAVMVGLLVVVLFGVAALTADLGNAWARKRDIQKQVDVAALSAGYMLPVASSQEKADIANEVAKYLNAPENRAIGQPLTTGAQLLAGTNGSVSFNAAGTQMSVVAPRGEVNVFFAHAFPGDQSDIRVTADATVEVRSTLPPKADTIPFWLPTGCAYGPGTADTSPPTGPSSPAPTTYVPPEVTGSHTITVVGQDSFDQNSSGTLTVRFGSLPNNSTGGTVRFSHPDGTVVNAVGLSWPETSTSSNSREVDVAMNPNVTGRTGTWRVWGLIDQGAQNQKVTADAAELDVVDPAGPTPSVTPAPTTDCSDPEVGNFGQLDSPREGVTQLQTRLALNLAEGIDHYVVPWATPPSDNNCGQSQATAILGAKLDVTSADGNNCLNVQQGNDGEAITKGLITGISGFKGRLDVTRPDGQTTCSSRSNVIIKSVTVNNDVLSCFLRNGATLEDIAQPGGPDTVDERWLSPSITKSPRFVWIPVVYAGDRRAHEFQALREYVPAFITDEKYDEITGANVVATSDNGIVMNNGTQQVESLQIFSFNPNILPPDFRSPDVEYDEDLPSIVRLVD